MSLASTRQQECRERDRERCREREREKERKRVSFVDGERSFGVGNGIGNGKS